jgi:hypothetical protein
LNPPGGGTMAVRSDGGPMKKTSTITRLQEAWFIATELADFNRRVLEG